MSDAPKRFVGLDLHKNYVMVGAVNPSQEMILSDGSVWSSSRAGPRSISGPPTKSCWKQVPMPGISTTSSNRWWPAWSWPIRPWWHKLDLSRTEKLRIRQDLVMLDQLAQPVKETATRLSVTQPWVQQVPYLIQLTGIGDIERFPTAKKLVGYAGLGARIHASGQTHKSGGITKQGRQELRTALIEAAWVTIRYDPHWQQQFEPLAKRMARHKAIVAIARKLLVVIWHLLSKKETDRRADPDRVAFSLMSWGWQVKPQWCDGLSTPQFIRYHLLLLDLDYIIRGKAKHRIAPAQEIIARCPTFEMAG